MAFDPNASQLSEEQIIQQVFDPDNRALRTNAFVQVDTINADLTVDIQASSGDNIAIANADGSKIVNVTTVGLNNALDVNIVQSTPTAGSATAANQVIEQGKLDTLHADLVTIEGKQDTGNASLSSIDGKINDNYGASSGAVRTAAQIGNTSGAADFNSGATTAQTLRVVLPTDQSAIPASQSGTWNINNISGTISLPTGAATETTVSAINTKIVTTVNGIKVDGSAVTQPISAVSLPLPSGASTSALQITANTSLASIDAGIPNALGAATIANSMPVNIASDQIVPVSVTSLPLPSGAATSANQTTEITSLQIIDDVPSAMNAAFNKGNTIMGQLDDTSTTVATEDNVAPVRITAQRSLHINLRNTAGTEIGTSANPIRQDPTGTTAQPITDNSGSLTIDTPQLATTLGQKTMANSAGVVIASDQTVIPVSDNGGSLTVDTPQLASTLGQKTMANSAAVVIASDQSTLPISAASLPLPTGAATETTLAKLPVAQASTTSGEFGILIQGAVTTAAPSYTNGQTDPLSLTTAGALRTDSSATTQPISAASLPLPTGAATSANQTTANTSLASIDAGIPNALGAATIANSMPVNIASDQVVPISATSLPLPTGAATSANQTTANTSLASIDSKLTSPLSVTQTESSSPWASSGYVATAATTRARVMGTAFSYQPLNNVLVVQSSSANDTLAGTGAQKILITYFLQDGSGPFTTTVNMSGTTIIGAGISPAFIQSVVVSQCGTDGTNDGTILLSGLSPLATMASIAIGDNETYYCHHVVPLGKTAYLTDCIFSGSSTTAARSAEFILKKQTITLATHAQLAIICRQKFSGTTSSLIMDFKNPILIAGPAVIQLFVEPDSATADTWYATIGGYEK